MKLSVIVPVYNVEKYLPRCLDSLLRQDLEDGEWEVICVNDGSPDGCATILADYEKKRPGIFRVITQENRGLNEARNTGMKAAQGEYVGFLDSDDYIIDGGYQYLLDHFCDEGVDVLQFGCVLAYTDGKTLHDSDAKPDGIISFDGDGADAYNRWPLHYVWSKLYRRAFLEKHNIQFEYTFLEDEPFNFEVFSHSPRLRIVTSKIYRYEQGNANSLLATSQKEKVQGQLKELINILGKTNRYLQNGDEKMASAAQRGINVYLRYYYNKMLKAHLTKEEWEKHTRQLKGLPIHQVDSSYEKSFLGKAIVHLKNWSGSSYPAYLMTEFLMNTVFERFIRPHIISSYDK